MPRFRPKTSIIYNGFKIRWEDIFSDSPANQPPWLKLMFEDGLLSQDRENSRLVLKDDEDTELASARAGDWILESESGPVGIVSEISLARDYELV